MIKKWGRKKGKREKERDISEYVVGHFSFPFFILPLSGCYRKSKGKLGGVEWLGC